MRGQKRPFWYLRRRSPAVASEVDEELNLHLELRIQELRARGLTADEARREALRQFGDLEGTRRYCRREDEAKETDMARALWIQDAVQDMRISIRSLMRAPMLTLTILATVGLGIGATTAIFGAAHAAFLRPLPYADSDRLMWIYTDTPPFRFRFSLVDYLALQEQQTHFERVAAYTDRGMTFSDGTVAEQLRGRLVSWTYFGLLGLPPAVGRDFVDADVRSGAPFVAIVTHGFWQQRLGGRADAIGRSIRLDGADYTVVGIAPPRLGPIERGVDFFLAAQWQQPKRKGPFLYTTLARFKAGASPVAAAEELRAINQRLFPIWKSSYQDDKSTWRMRPLEVYVVGDAGTTAGLALAAVALVWLIACTNASNLLIARVTSRKRELAVRAALGASRGRVVRYLLAESAILAAGAVVIGLILARAGVDLLRTAGANYFPRTQEIAFDAPILGVMAALTLASLCIFGLIPAIHGSGGPMDESLRALGRSATGSTAVRRLRQLLVGAQFAIVTPLLVVAGLLLVSLNELRKVEVGIDGRNVITGSIRLPGAQYADGAAMATFWEEFQRRVEALPGVTRVAFTDSLPPDGAGNFNNFDLEEFPTPQGQSQPVTPWVAVTPEYFSTIGVSLIQGRLLQPEDALRENLETIVVDRAWEKRFFPNQSAVGKRLKEGGCTQCPWTEVVGVVSTVKYAGLEQPDQGTVYTPLGRSLYRSFVLRAETDPRTVIGSVRTAARDLEPAAPFANVATIDELVSQSLQQPQSLSMLVGGFALVALVLSVVGIYGVMAYYVQQHLKDISIRLALGGSAKAVLRLIVGQGMAVVASGIVLGLLSALALTRWMSSLLFGIGAADAFTFVIVSAFLFTVALAACLVPAVRAVGLQPAAVLRNE